MISKYHSSLALARAKGIGLPAAIFVITLLVVIAASINLLVGQNAQTFDEEVNLTRAFFAAETGAGFIMNNIYPPEDYPGYAGSFCAGSGSPVSYSFTVEGLANCSASVECNDDISISGTTYTTITSTGTCDDVSRTVQVRTVY